MIRCFIVHQWKESVRSSIWHRNIAANIAIGFLVLLMFGYLLMLGIFMDPILRDVFPDDDPVVIFNSGLIYYFLADLFLRYMMQGLPVFNIESYLHLPVRKSSIVHFVACRTLLSPFNYLPLLIFLPVAFRTVYSEYQGIQAASWVVSLFLLILVNNFLATFLKRRVVSKPMLTAFAGLAILLAGLFDYLGWINLTALSSKLFGMFIDTPLSFVAPLALLVIFYLVNYRYLRNRLYPDEVIRQKAITVADIPRIKYLDSLGLTGDLVRLEMRLWWRNKRTRTILYMLPVFLLYGLFFYPQPIYKNAGGFLVFVGVFMSGGLMMNYLNYAFGYESNYFDGILTRKIDFKRYIRAKFSIGVLATTICFILTIPYVFFDPYYLLVNFVTYLFNIGVLSYLLLYMATFNQKRLDLSKSSAFNYQGVSGANWLIVMFCLLLPVLLYAPFNYVGGKYLGLTAIAVPGLLGLLFRKPLLDKVGKSFMERKYIMASGFRQGQ
jgi:hypothetical protein